MRIKSLALAACAALLVSSCASVNETLYSDANLARRIADKYGVSVSEVTISNRVTNASGSYFNISIPSQGVNERCHIYANIGGLGLMSFEPTCGDQMGRNPLTGR